VFSYGGEAFENLFDIRRNAVLIICKGCWSERTSEFLHGIENLEDVRRGKIKKQKKRRWRRSQKERPEAK
jgi:hypothetical protein